MRSEHPELAGPPKRCLGATVSWPWIPVLGSLEPPRRDGENAQKTGKNGEKMGEIRPKTCEGVGITCSRSRIACSFSVRTCASYAYVSSSAHLRSERFSAALNHNRFGIRTTMFRRNGCVKIMPRFVTDARAERSSEREETCSASSPAWRRCFSISSLRKWAASSADWSTMRSIAPHSSGRGGVPGFS